MSNPHPWLKVIPLIFFEGEEDNNGENNDNQEKEGENQNDPPEKTSFSAEEIDNLVKTMKAERARANRLEGEKKKREKDAEDAKLKEQGEITLLTKKLEDEKQKAQRLGNMFFRTALDSAIEREAKLLNFIDTDDAVSGVDRSLIEAEQDPDDPSVIAIDQASIKKAVKALADRKKHLVRTGTEDNQPSGSSFGGTKQKTGDKETERLTSLYANL